MDYSARVLIRYCLTQAAQNALNKSAEWVRLANAAGSDEGAEFPLVHLIIGEDSLLKGSDPSERENKRIEGHIERLETFTTMAIAMIHELRKAVKPARSVIRQEKGGKAKRKKIGRSPVAKIDRRKTKE